MINRIILAASIALAPLSAVLHAQPALNTPTLTGRPLPGQSR
jgi:hypothetical protein